MADQNAPTILLIDDEGRDAEDMADLLVRSGYDCTIAKSGREGLERLARQRFDMVLTDATLKDLDGLEILKQVRSESPDTEVVFISAQGTIASAVKAMQEGAETYLVKPVNTAELRAIVSKALGRQALVRDNRDLHRALDERLGVEGIIAGSPAMRQVLETVKQIAPTTATVLVTGESGTGKELIARALHNNSARKGRPFVALNCAALSSSVLESELFGHEKGAFTGAVTQRKGRFEYAQGGTLFLDEVGDLPLDIQVKLLRVIEEREIIRVGANVPITVDVRLVAATNRDLGALVSQGKFREDLFFRLNVVSLRLPPLRERKEELSLFIERFLPEFARGFGKKVTSISLEARKILFRHDWPGNVRELKNAIESMAAVTRDEILGVDDLPDYLMARAAAATVGMAPGLTMKEAQRRLVQGTLDMVRGSRAEAAKILEIPEESVALHLRPPPGAPQGGAHPAHRVHEILPGMTVEAAERILIRETLEAVEGNRKKAARMLAIGERTLYRKIKQYGLE